MTRRGLGLRLRERNLASDQRAGIWARGKARRAQYDFVWRNQGRLTLLALGTLSPQFALLPFLPGGFARGLLVGAWTTAVAGLLTFLIVQATGTAPVITSEQGEQFTASELRKLQHGGWRMVNHVALRAWDIDHVLVGPAGVYAVETKWSATDWITDPPDARVRASLDQTSSTVLKAGGLVADPCRSATSPAHQNADRLGVHCAAAHCQRG